MKRQPFRWLLGLSLALSVPHIQAAEPALLKDYLPLPYHSMAQLHEPAWDFPPVAQRPKIQPGQLIGLAPKPRVANGWTAPLAQLYHQSVNGLTEAARFYTEWIENQPGTDVRSWIANDSIDSQALSPITLESPIPNARTYPNQGESPSLAQRLINEEYRPYDFSNVSWVKGSWIDRETSSSIPFSTMPNFSSPSDAPVQFDEEPQSPTNREDTLVLEDADSVSGDADNIRYDDSTDSSLDGEAYVYQDFSLALDDDITDNLSRLTESANNLPMEPWTIELVNYIGDHGIQRLVAIYEASRQMIDDALPRHISNMLAVSFHENESTGSSQITRIDDASNIEDVQEVNPVELHEHTVYEEQDSDASELPSGILNDVEKPLDSDLDTISVELGESFLDDLDAEGFRLVEEGSLETPKDDVRDSSVELVTVARELTNNALRSLSGQLRDASEWLQVVADQIDVATQQGSFGSDDLIEDGLPLFGRTLGEQRSF